MPKCQIVVYNSSNCELFRSDELEGEVTLGQIYDILNENSIVFQAGDKIVLEESAE